MKKKLSKILFFIAPLSLGIIFSIYINEKQDILEGVSATVLPEAKPLPQFSLEDHLGKAFTNESLSGQWSFVFFGYTHCPDICPTTLVLLNQVDEILKKTPDAASPKTIFISVDPERDTKDLLANYVTYFNSEFIGVRGSLQQLQNLTMSLGITFGKDSYEHDDYEIFHSAVILLIDSRARLKALFSSPHDVNQMASDYMKIVN